MLLNLQTATGETGPQQKAAVQAGSGGSAESRTAMGMGKLLLPRPSRRRIDPLTAELGLKLFGVLGLSEAELLAIVTSPLW
jgi:hypothetical protein